MKKILFALSAALMLFVACDNNEEGKKMSFVLTQDNIEVADLTDYLVVVDAAAKTVAIEIPYADKESLAALGVNFVGVPSTVTVENFTFDFSTGATKEVVFTEGELTATYVFSATAAAPQPKLQNVVLKTAAVSGEGEDQTVTYGPECPVAAGVARMKGFDNLTKVAMSFTVSPANTEVYYTKVNDDATETEVQVASGDILNFSDKVNGITFTLKCDGIEAQQTVKVATSGFSKIERVWGRYNSSTDAATKWYDNNAIFTGQVSNFRNVAMDENYIYLPNTNSGLVYVIDRATGNPVMDGEEVKTLKTKNLANEDVVTGSVFKVCGIHTIKDGNNTGIIVGSFTNSPSSPLKIYYYSSIDAVPVLLTSYTSSKTSIRLGDKFTVAGTMQDGEIYFFDAQTKDYVLSFKLSNGQITDTEEVALSVPAATYSGLYQFSSTEYIWAGNFAAGGDCFHIFNKTADGFVSSYSSNVSATFKTMHDLHFITVNDQKYMIYYSLFKSKIRISEVGTTTLKEKFESTTVAQEMQSDKYKFIAGEGPTDAPWDADTDVPNETVPNGLGGLDVAVVGDDVYVVGMAPTVGISLFKLVL